MLQANALETGAHSVHRQTSGSPVPVRTGIKLMYKTRAVRLSTQAVRLSTLGVQYMLIFSKSDDGVV